MSDETQGPAASVSADADVTERARISIVWLLPAIAVLLGGWLLFKSIRDRGVAVTVTFETADGLEAGKTAIRYRDVQVGLIQKITVAESRDHVVVEMTIDRESQDMISAKTLFWVVRPRATLQGISGLGTLLSGAYVAIEPGDSPSGDKTREFEGLEAPPLLDRGSPGARYVLKADAIGSISVGSPIHYRGIAVGEVTKYALDDDAEGVTVEVFVNDPHHRLVLQSSRFWNASGINVTAGADGLEVDTASLEALLIGGIEFDSPKSARQSRPAPDGTTFKLYSHRRDVALDTPDAERYVCYFEDSLRGLEVNAPVEFRGLRIGHVESIDVERYTDGDLRLPVTVAVRPEQFGVSATEDDAARAEALKRSVSRGLRVRLSSGSLLTGALFVEVVVDNSAPPQYHADKQSPLPEVPTVSSGLASIEKTIGDAVHKLDGILTKIDELPMQELVQNASDAAASIDKLASSPDLAEAIISARKVMDDLAPAVTDLRAVMTEVDSGMKSVVEQMQLTAEQLRGTLVQAERSMAAVAASMGPDSAAQADLSRALTEMSRAARSMRELASYLERHPEALLNGKSDTGGQ